MCDCIDCGDETDRYTFMCENVNCTNYICNYHSYEQDNGQLWCSECAKKKVSNG